MTDKDMILKNTILDRIGNSSTLNNCAKQKGHTDFSIRKILEPDSFSKNNKNFPVENILDLSKTTQNKNLLSSTITVRREILSNRILNDFIIKPKVYKFSDNNYWNIDCRDCAYYLENYNNSSTATKSFWCLKSERNFYKNSSDQIKSGVEYSLNLKSSIIDDEVCYKCKTCDKVFSCAYTLESHEKTHKSPRYECNDCGKGFSQLRNYKYHLSVHRGTKEFATKCPECGKTFNDKGYLSSHMKIHRNKKEYECPYCPKSFNQRVAFNMHVRIHTGVKPHKCAECGKRFSRKMLLKQHMRTHSGEKPYQCTVCGKSFADRSNMTLHHRLHSGVKPFTCTICPKAFTKKHHLKTHLNYHTGCKPYVCPHPNCNQAFTQSSNMRTHSKKCQYRPVTNLDSINGFSASIL